MGINVHQEGPKVFLNQKEYLDAIEQELLPYEAMRDKMRMATEEEKRIFRLGVGQLGWLTNNTKPEGAYMYCLLSTLQSKPKIADFLKFTILLICMSSLST